MVTTSSHATSPHHAAGHAQALHEGRRIRGVPLALKLAGVIALVVALFMLIFGMTLSRFVENLAREQVMRSAVETARLAASADLVAWSPLFGTVDQGLSADERQARYEALSEFERRQYDNDAARKAQMEWNKERLQRVLSADSRILAADVIEYRGEAPVLVARSYAGSLEFTPALGQPPLESGQGEARLGLLRLGQRQETVIRGSYPIVRADGSVPGEVSVYIKAEAVHAAVSDFNLKVAYASMLFILVGAGISFLLGRRVTRPLVLLQDDMRAVAAGDLSHHTRSRSVDEIGDLAHTFEMMTRSLAEAREAERDAAASQHQMAVAAEVTASLFPDQLPRIPGFDVAGLTDPSHQLAGEYYDVLPMHGGRWGFLVAGASGEGVPAAMVMGMARASLRAVAQHASDPGAVLREVNALISPDLRKGMFVTMLLVVLDPRRGHFAAANAGHGPLLHYHGAEERLGEYLSEGIALGFDKGPVFDETLKVIEHELKPGDRLVLATTGVHRVQGADGTELGEKRFCALVKREAAHPAEEFVERVHATLRKFHHAEISGEDVTLLTVGRQA